MRTTSQQVVETGLDLVLQIVKAMSAHPELVRLDVEETAGGLGLTVTAHPSDTRRIVGRGAANLQALDSLTRLLFWGSGGLVKFYPLVALKVAEDERKPFKPVVDWPAEDIIGLLEWIACTVFAGSAYSVKIERHDEMPCATKLVVIVDGDVGPVLGRFANAAAQVFQSIGQVRGRVLYVVAKSGEPKPTRTMG